MATYLRNNGNPLLSDVASHSRIVFQKNSGLHCRNGVLDINMDEVMPLPILWAYASQRCWLIPGKRDRLFSCKWHVSCELVQQTRMIRGLDETLRAVGSMASRNPTESKVMMGSRSRELASISLTRSCRVTSVFRLLKVARVAVSTSRT